MKDCKIIGFKEYRIFLWFTIYWLGQAECGDFKESLYSIKIRKGNKATKCSLVQSFPLVQCGSGSGAPTRDHLSLPLSPAGCTVHSVLQ